MRRVRQLLQGLAFAAALAPAGAVIADTAVPFAANPSVTVPATGPAAAPGYADFAPRRVELVCAIAGCLDASAGQAVPRRPVTAQSTDRTIPAAP
jgi:hypothetical protein